MTLFDLTFFGYFKGSEIIGNNLSYHIKDVEVFEVDMKYIRDLHNADDRVESVSPQIGKSNRVFIGIIVMQHGVKYCIPLSHPKEKHKRMANNAELHKIIVEGKLIGILNFNLMIPVTEE